ncbi:MAG TPA: response regulator, partial [Candidatus Thermoplasmatota archaeon]|nr:response regulator [Candidatus Thermoplasmatota archaeon]
MPPAPLKVLLIEDNADDAELVERALGGAEPEFHLDWVERLEEGKQRLGREAYGVVLLDLDLPDRDGLETFLDLHASAPDVPVVILSGLDDAAVAREGVKHGAQDFLLKDEATPAGLRHAIRYAVERQNALREREDMRRQLEAARQEAQAERARADLIAGFAHRLRTPLTPLRIAVGLLKVAPPEELGPRQREAVDLLERNVERFYRLVESILEEAGIRDQVGQPGEAGGVAGAASP